MKETPDKILRPGDSFGRLTFLLQKNHENLPPNNFFFVTETACQFGYISQEVRTDFVDNCTKIAQDTQITLLVTDSEYTSSTKKKITGKEKESATVFLII